MRGRKRLFNDVDVKYIRDNPDQLSYSELAIRYQTSIQTIRRVIMARGAYSIKEELVNA